MPRKSLPILLRPFGFTPPLLARSLTKSTLITTPPAPRSTLFFLVTPFPSFFSPVLFLMRRRERRISRRREASPASARKSFFRRIVGHVDAPAPTPRCWSDDRKCSLKEAYSLPPLFLVSHTFRLPALPLIPSSPPTPNTLKRKFLLFAQDLEIL